MGKVPAHVLAKRGVAYVPQGRDIFPMMTVRENLETGYACLPANERTVSDEIFELFPRRIQAERFLQWLVVVPERLSVCVKLLLVVARKKLLWTAPTSNQLAGIRHLGKYNFYYSKTIENVIFHRKTMLFDRNSYFYTKNLCFLVFGFKNCSL